MDTRVFEQDDKVIIHSHADCQPIIERNKILAEIENSKHGQEMYHVASFPSIIIEQYINSAGITLQEFMDNEEHLNRIMSNPDLSGFRVRAGKF